MSPDVVLVVNAGSSSLKFALVEPATGRSRASGIVERVGRPPGSATFHGRSGTTERAVDVADHAAAFALVGELFAADGQPLDAAALAAVGHRVVHGGERFSAPTLLDDDVVAQIARLAELAPLHNPPNVAGIRAARAAFPGLPHVAVFDTAFFHGLPAVAATYAIDRDTATRYGLRRYGFHGTSHAYVSGLVPGLLDRDPARVDQIVLHLGNGASASAIRGGTPIDTSMGLTPLEGLMMGTRSGDVDPGLLLHLMRVAGLDADQLDDLLNHRSGLLGLAGAVDMRDVLAKVDAGDAAAALAVEVYCYRIRKYVGAYYAALGSLDAIVFTAGVGEHAPPIRARSLAGLERLGIAVDPARNEAVASGPRAISPDGSPVTVLVVPTDEELAIAVAALGVARQVADPAR